MRDMAAQTRRILVGYDDSDAARRALDRAADLAGYGSTLTVVSVSRNGGGVAREALESAREHLLRRHVSATYLQPAGDPAETIVGEAENLGADLVVVGRRGGGSLRRLVLGSVSNAVVRGAPCDVLVVP
jgi:nucleotide-binding universal stress UspA family protein